MRSATSRFDASGTSTRLPSRRRRTTAFVSPPKPAPGRVTSFATTRSRFFPSSFFAAFARRSSVSAAKPTRTRPPFASPSPFRMSGVRTRSSVAGPSVFLSFDVLGDAGR